jgi:hypothetical protein
MSSSIVVYSVFDEYGREVCAACGSRNFGFLEEHHIDGRKNSNRVVHLCPNCHSIEERGLLVVDNSAYQEAAKELQRLYKDRGWASQRELIDLLERHGYKPYFDDEYKWLVSQGFIHMPGVGLVLAEGATL